LTALAQRTIRLTMAQALVKYLHAQYSERDGVTRRLVPGVFGIFGHGNVHGLGQALLEFSGDMPYLPTRNEQGMVHIAAAYAKETRRRSTYACASSIGPGSTNMITGAALATINRLPVLLLPADTFETRLQGPVLQGLEHPLAGNVSVNDCFRPVSRYYDRIGRPQQLLAALPEACRVLTSPVETGAVVLSLPQDTQSEAFDYPASFFEQRSWRIERPLPSGQRIREAVELLKRATRPAIVAGGGVRYSEAEADVLRFASELGIPVAETFAGKGCLGSDSWLALGGMGTSGNQAANQVLREADLVIWLGSRMTDTQTGSHTLFQDPDVRFVSVNVSERDAAKDGALPIVADIRETLRALLDEAKRAGITPRPDYEGHVRRLVSEWRTVLDAALRPANGAMSQGEIVQLLNQFVSPGDVVIGASGTLPGDLLKVWNTVGGRDCYLEFGYSCMAHEIPAGIGVRLARSGGEVYVLLGDGAFLLNPTEIVTAVQLEAKATFIVSENRGFEAIHGIQMRRTGPGDLGNEFRTRNSQTDRRDGEYLELDLARIAEGLGAVSFRADTATGFCEALARARQERRPCVIVVRNDPHRRLPDSGAWREIAPAEVSGDPEVRRIRALYEEERRLQRFYHSDPSSGR